MSKVLVIPDTHLKPKMFDLADKIMQERGVDYAVQLGDNFDDFLCYDDQYRNHNVRMLRFAHDYPKTVWLWGNHEISYILGRPVTGNTFVGEDYARSYQEDFNPKFIHLDGKVLFSHAGVFQEFVDRNGLAGCKTVEELTAKMNELDMVAFWQDDSPIWARPQYERLTVPRVLEGYLQVVGHTPMREVMREGGVVTTDVFSTNWGQKIGVERMVVVDTAGPDFEVVEADFRGEFGWER